MKSILLCAYSISPESQSEPGVAWKQFVEIIKLNKYSFVLFTRKKNVKDVEKYLRKENITNVSIEGVDLPRKLLFWKKGHLAMHIYYYVWQLMAYFRAKSVVKTRDVVLAHHISFMTIRTSFVSFLGIPSIVGPVGGAQLPPPGFEKILPGWKNYLRTISILSMKYSPLWRRFIHNTELIILANSENTHIIPKEDLPRCKVLQIPWWSSVTKSRKQVELISDEYPKGKIRLLWCSRLIKWKGLEVAMLSLKQLVEKYNFDNFCLDVVGRGEDLSYYQRLAESLELTGNINFRGFVTEEEKDILFSKADVCLFTSLHETTGTTLFEYLDYSKCVVVLGHAGPREIGDNTGCEMVDCSRGLSDAVDQLADTLYKLGIDPELREHIAVNSNKIFLEDYSPSVYITKIEQFYEVIAND